MPTSSRAFSALPQPLRARSIVPPYLLARIAQADSFGMARAAEAARRSLLADPPLRLEREHAADRSPATPPSALAVPVTAAVVDRTVFDAGNTETLPGREVRREADAPVDDVAVNEAFDGLGATHALLLEAFGRDSVDGTGLPLLATVHYGRDYDNAFWDGERMVFGDGDGEVFGRFTASLSVIGHELAHGVTQFTAGLIYEGQSGALNESFSDVLGALVEQHQLGQRADAASWLIGEGLFTDAVEGRALRSMIAPGTAYDDDVLGRDPQPADMAGYVDTRDDNGGVHLNSGIPNRAFALAATELGGFAWERAGQVWYDTVVGLAAPLDPRSTFEQFAEATMGAARARFGEESAELSAIDRAWRTVGVRSDDTPG
ncbi:M4 family metallopeptidase [Herbiconiux ginsengi]|uniref:Neutral metalloproteinase n=1 Tax=Herbiconiux ginsengi TaxID=381665 RepID=A0A1H3QJ94_9MICO|nr:M4 family metallopeptidase [Herbiconiux ginsengi]SDZ13486.1 Thermolysin metallopeptidase, catalytic domain [Herbiconiux ginsengi]